MILGEFFEEKTIFGSKRLFQKPKICHFKEGRFLSFSRAWWCSIIQSHSLLFVTAQGLYIGFRTFAYTL